MYKYVNKVTKKYCENAASKYDLLYYNKAVVTPIIYLIIIVITSHDITIFAINGVD